ncbi:DoxX family membrane protein [Lentzea sp.]|uniref:DoxX family membrane protein n=1 Tax=Lentzea sp. TaxID=56099 RepID=UPI002B6A1026|nr:DoxX family membrane protein [Lentzea sp.]HUQ61538.1 DoxX family membrane protein [Lentzea sp.]
MPTTEAPEFFGGLSAVTETVCGALLLARLLTRLAALPMLVNVALALAPPPASVPWRIPLPWAKSACGGRRS